MDEYEKLEEELKKVYEVIIYSRVLVSTEYLAFFAMFCQISLLHRAFSSGYYDKECSYNFSL